MKTTTIQLVNRKEVGVDELGSTIFEEQIFDVVGVLIGLPTSDDAINTLQLYGKRIAYTLGIPKGDTHNWIDSDVIIWGKRYRTIGYPTTAEESNIPLKWGSVVKVEHYG